MSTKYKIREWEGLYFLTCSVVGWIDVFSRKSYRDIVLQSLAYCQQHKKLHLHAYVIMSNHIHLIAWAEKTPQSTLSTVMRDFKKFTSKAIYSAIQEEAESRRSWLLYMFQYFANLHHPKQQFHFWQNDNHPLQLWSPKVIIQKLNYIHQNPVKAGIVEFPEDYLYSSARNYSGQSGLLDVELLDAPYRLPY